MERIVRPDVDRGRRSPVESKEFIRVVQVHEQEIAVEIVLAEIGNPGNPEFRRQIEFGIFRQFDSAVLVPLEEFCDVRRGVDQDPVADVQSEFARDDVADDHLAAFQGVFPRKHDIVQTQAVRRARRVKSDDGLRNERVVLLEQHGRDDGRQSLAARLLDHRRNPVRIVDHHRAEFRADLRMGGRIEQFVPHLVGESAHHGENDDQHRHAERHADHRNQRDDRNRAPLRFEIFPREKKFCSDIHCFPKPCF